MNLKKIKIIAVLGITLLSFLSHFAYEIFPNIIFVIVTVKYTFLLYS